MEARETHTAEGRVWEMLLQGAGRTPPSTKNNSLPYLATPLFSVGFLVEASVRNIHVRRNMSLSTVPVLCAPERHPVLLPCSPCWWFCRFKAQARNAKTASSLGEEEHLVERQRVNMSITAPPPHHLPALEFKLHSAVIETRLFNTGANYCLLMQGAVIDTAITQLC